MAPVTDQRPLNEVARHVIVPAGIASTGWPQVRNTCRNLGWRFDRWQAGAGWLILAKDAEGQYAADTIVISIPRQCGKTFLVACIVFALCLIRPNLTVVWTAHRKTTAVETFESLAGMAVMPRVAPYIEKVLNARGSEKIVFTNGSRILLGARETGFGRGIPNVGVIVADEAQILTESFMEDMAATQNTVDNPLFFMMGTPPRPQDNGEVFASMRQEAIDGEVDDTCYIEFSAPEKARDDPMNPDYIAEANPSFPHRTSWRALMRLRKKLKNLAAWCREALGIWDEVVVDKPVLTQSFWGTLTADGPDHHVAPNGIGVDMGHGGDISVTGCWFGGDDGDTAHLELLWAGTDIDACITFLARAAGRRIEVLIDDLSPAAQMIPDLVVRRVNVRRGTTRDMVKACQRFESRGRARQLSHTGQELVTKALLDARKRKIGDAGGWGFDRRNPESVIHPIVGTALALLAGTETHRPKTSDPKRVRKAVMG
ncbi:terminase [Mycobacterium sp. CBMA293]|uniref:terminase n=1 Tax=unclassified Mycolicibacterium TaxID=2636767 RepID=UPI0012DDCF30|nr:MULTISPECIES: terminase [unclassified Mycolicibacterium]MUL47594.1 terminase [Mycolicibacterium sp. CBMA 360]MUL61888.1 terminase [Mycolicibacterium sp. CBMA 335]MUL68961.1 terminase [Mycolicibacterium sp. CBMA 311]MUL92822.1 terminase [Mycolicibacterium sp. CBMA 230]MUM08736.1 terminase [Mycolicibacterium sp. CBMA 213]